MVNIQFFNNKSKDLVADKVLTPLLSTQGDFRATVDALQPTVMVEGTIPAGANYAYIPDFGRFYYVTDRDYITKDLCNLSLKTDVRKSFATQLYAARGIVQRNTQLYDMYLNDPKIPVGAHKALAIKKFGSTPFGNRHPLPEYESAYYSTLSILVFGGGT